MKKATGRFREFPNILPAVFAYGNVALLLVKYSAEVLGAKNNDSTSEKQAIVKFYTMEYRKCGNFNSKNDSRLWLGASAISQSVDFRAFEINVKTIASTQKLYQSGHAIWCGRSAAQLMGSLLPDLVRLKSSDYKKEQAALSGPDTWVDICLDKSRVKHYKGTDIGRRMEELGQVTLRMVKAPLPEDREEALITNLPTETFDCRQIAELYHMRWGLKRHMRH